MSVKLEKLYNMKVLTLIFLMLCAVSVRAEMPDETVRLADGTIMSGYISFQDNRGNMRFKSQKTLIQLSNSSRRARLKYSREITPTMVPSAYKDAIADFKNKTGEYMTTEKYSLATMSNVDGSEDDVLVLDCEDGLKCITLKPHEYDFGINGISRILRMPPSLHKLSGYKDKVVLSDGSEKVGYNVETVPGEYIRLLVDDVPVKIAADDIVKTMKVRQNENLDYMQQTSIMDLCKFKAGIVVKGLVLEQDYGNDRIVIYDIDKEMPVTRSLGDLVSRTYVPNVLNESKPVQQAEATQPQSDNKMSAKKESAAERFRKGR